MFHVGTTWKIIFLLMCIVNTRYKVKDSIIDIFSENNELKLGKYIQWKTMFYFHEYL